LSRQPILLVQEDVAPAIVEHESYCVMPTP
jgi:hypothetical protein